MPSRADLGWLVKQKDRRDDRDRDRRKSLSCQTGSRRLNRQPRSKSVCSPGMSIAHRKENIAVDILEDDETEEQDCTLSDLNGARDGNNSCQSRKDSVYLMEEITRKAERQQKRATVMVNSGALTFILLAAALVTTSLLMSPVIEQIFGKRDYWSYLPLSIIPKYFISVVDNLASNSTNSTNATNYLI